MSITVDEAQRMSVEELYSHRALYSFHRPTVEIINAELRRRAGHDRREQQLRQNIENLEQRVNSLNSANAQLAEAVRNSNREIQRMDRDHRARTAEMQRDYARRLAEADRQNLQRLQELERENAAERERMRSDYTMMIRRSEQVMREFVGEVAGELNENMDRIRTETNQRIDMVQTQVDGIRNIVEAMGQTDNERRTQGREIYQAAIAVREATDEYNRVNGHDWEAQRRRELANAESLTQLNLNDSAQGAGISARNLALQQLNNALIFREEVFAREREWQTAHALTEAAVIEVGAQLENDRHIMVGDEEVDVDYWTCGELGRIGQRINGLNERLKDPSQTLEQMENDRQLAIQYRGELEEACIFALQARQMSYDRMDLLDNAIDYLVQSQNMRFIWAEYYGGDERLGRRAYLRREGDGLEIVITAEPVPQVDGTIVNQLRSDIIHYPVGEMNEQRIETLQRQIMSELGEGTGLPFTKPECAQHKDPNYTIDTQQFNGDRDRYLHVSDNALRQRLEQQATPRHQGQARTTN